MGEVTAASKGLERETSDSGLHLSSAVGWAIGSTGTAILLGTVNTLLLKYVVDTLLLSAILAGTIITATRFLDAAIDPIMGLISDRTRTRWGRRRPYLMVGGFACAASLVILFSDPFGVALLVPALYLTIALCVYAVAYTIFAVPYIAMSYEIATTKQARTMLMSFRVYAASAGMLVAQAAAPWIVERSGGGMDGFANMGWVTGCAVLLACSVSFFATSKASAITVTIPAVRPRLRDFGAIISNKPFLKLISAKGCYHLGTGVQGAALAFLLTVALEKDLSSLGLLSSFLLGAVILSQPAWVWVCNRIGKRNAFMIAAPLNALANLSWLFATPEESTLVFILRGIAIGIAGGGMTLVVQAMLPDTLQHEADRGGSQEGMLSGFFTTIERGASALSVALAGAIMSFSGYISGAALQSDQAITSLYFCVAVAPALGMLAAALCLRKYTL